MEDYFNALSKRVLSKLKGEEQLLLNLQAEDSDFVRFNRGEVRQPGHVSQSQLSLRLLEGQRHVSGLYTLSGDLEQDALRLSEGLEELRQALAYVPPDPHLLFNEVVQSTTRYKDNTLPTAELMTEQIAVASRGVDLAGILATGTTHRGFANSLGQTNWFSSPTFNFDFSTYLDSQRASKGRYAGFDWNAESLKLELDQSQQQLRVLDRPVKALEPGHYNAYLAPAALAEVFALMSWRGFGIEAQKTHASPLTRLANGESRLNEMFNLSEQTSLGVGPDFQEFGFIKPARVPLVQRGQHGGALISARSAKEYGVEPNGASAAEAPEALSLEPGSLSNDKVTEQLGEGLYISELWYMNYSDRPSGRMTGMTRFATFWVEAGQLHSPVDVMRFDESLYKLFGAKLVALTEQRELLLSSETYDRRATSCMLLPGALVQDFTLTL